MSCQQVSCVRCGSIYVIPIGPVALSKHRCAVAVEWLKTHECEAKS